MKAQGMFFTTLFAIDVFFVGFFVGFNSRHVMVVDPTLPVYKSPAVAQTTAPSKPGEKTDASGKASDNPEKKDDKANKTKDSADKKHSSDKGGKHTESKHADTKHPDKPPSAHKSDVTEKSIAPTKAAKSEKPEKGAAPAGSAVKEPKPNSTQQKQPAQKKTEAAKPSATSDTDK